VFQGHHAYCSYFKGVVVSLVFVLKAVQVLWRPKTKVEGQYIAAARLSAVQIRGIP
jgi:hypothetical protein